MTGVGTLASYVPELRDLSDEWRLRVLLHEFGYVWATTAPADRPALIATEPEPFDVRWDAFVAAYAEHLAWHEGIEVPDWVYGADRYLPAMWFPANDLDTLRVEAIVHSPAAFEAHGVLLADRELIVV